MHRKLREKLIRMYGIGSSRCNLPIDWARTRCNVSNLLGVSKYLSTKYLRDNLCPAALRFGLAVPSCLVCNRPEISPLP